MPSVRPLAVYLIIPLLVIGFALLSEYSGLDLWLESRFYDEATGAWPYKSLFITSVILHTWGRYFIVACALTNLFAILASFFSTTLAPYRKHLLYIFIAAITGPLLVNMLKGITYIHTPWDLQLFGGDTPYLRIFDAVHAGASIGHAFPGGHSSGGFAYVCMFFALTAMRSPYRIYGLLIPTGIGLVFAATQEIRGAHFLSHDLFSFAICWLVALAAAVVFYPDIWKSPAAASQH